MTRFLQIAALLAILFTLTNTASANGLSKKSGGSTASHGPTKNGGIDKHGPSRTYHRDHHWNSRYWNSRYGCEFCYSAFDRCYFYFYAPAGCYYPVSSIAEYPPTPAAAPTPAPVAAPIVAPGVPSTVVQVNQNTNVNR